MNKPSNTKRKLKKTKSLEFIINNNNNNEIRLICKWKIDSISRRPTKMQIKSVSTTLISDECYNFLFLFYISSMLKGIAKWKRKERNCSDYLNREAESFCVYFRPLHVLCDMLQLNDRAWVGWVQFRVIGLKPPAVFGNYRKHISLINW